jgi:hypothetical protein
MSTLNESDLQSTVPARLGRALADANSLRSAGLSTLAKMWQARIGAHKLELLRLTAKYGAEAEETLAASRILQAAETFQPMIQAELIRTQMPEPRPDPSAFTLFGRVVDRAMTPAARARIAISLGDRKDVVIGQTTEQGEFILILPAQEGITKLHIEVTDSRSSLTTFDESIELKPGVVFYSEFIT